MAGIYGPNGEWIEFSDSPSKDEMVAEFATRLSAGADISGFLGWLPDPDPILRKRGDSAKVLEELTADEQVCMAMQSRKLRVLNKGDYDFYPGLITGQEASADSKKLCEALTKDLERIKLIDVFSSILDAPFYGFSVLELMWRAEGGMLRLDGVEAKPQHWFAFNEENKLVFRGENNFEGKPVPEGKFVLVRHFPTYENPYGLRLLSRCLWPVAFKRGGTEFLVKFLERFGMPWVVATAQKGAKQHEMNAMASNLAAMVQDAVLVLPAGANVDLAKSDGKSSEIHESFLQRQDKAISKVLMGQTLTAEMDGKNGSRAASETHYSVASDIEAADSFMLTSAMNDIALAYRDINAAPTVLAPVFGFNEPEDFNEQADLDGKLHKIGVRFKKSHFVRRYGLAQDEFELGGQSGEKPGSDEESESFAEGDDHQAIVDEALEAVLPEAVKASEETTRLILEAVDRAESFEDMQLLLAELLGGEASQSDLEELMANLLTNTELYGRFAAKEEHADA
jgi:phage gp29-like protein